MAKAYRRYPTIEAQWRIAVEQLQEADRVVIVGLSFAPSDVRLTWLMRYGLRKFGARAIDVVYCRSEHDPKKPLEHAVVRRVKDFAPKAKVNPHADGFAEHLADTGAAD